MNSQHIRQFFFYEMLNAIHGDQNYRYMFLIELKLLLLTKAMKIYFENQPYKHLVKKGLKHIPTTKVTVCLKVLFTHVKFETKV